MDRTDLYFVTLVSWTLHPGYQREGAKKPTLDEIGDLVDAMLKMRDTKWPQQSEQSEAP